MCRISCYSCADYYLLLDPCFQCYCLQILYTTVNVFSYLFELLNDIVIYTQIRFGKCIRLCVCPWAYASGPVLSSSLSWYTPWFHYPPRILLFSHFHQHVQFKRISYTGVRQKVRFIWQEHDENVHKSSEDILNSYKNRKRKATE